MALLQNFIILFTESAPFLLVGLGLAGIIKFLIPSSFIEKFLGKQSSVFTAAMIGMPLPLCSCSVIPTALGIRRSGASKASTTSFMISTPETGIDSVAVTYALFGPVMAIARPIAAVASAVIAGYLVKIIDQETPVKQGNVTSCCQSSDNKSHLQQTLYQQVKNIFTYAYGKLLSDFIHWLLIGLFFAALIQTYVPATLLTDYDSSVWIMLMAVVISVPMYICATASTPIAAGLMLSGISPGAALVFMLAGPATNIATLMVVKTELGNRSLAAYLIGVIITAVLSGLALDLILQTFHLNITLSITQHNAMTSIIYSVAAISLALLIALQYAKILSGIFVKSSAQ